MLITCPTHGMIVVQQVFSAFHQLVVAAAAAAACEYNTILLDDSPR